MTRSTTLFTLTGLLLVAGAIQAQDAPEPARVERVFVPEEAFDRVVRRFPRGVVVRDKEFDELLRLAGLKPVPVAPEASPPVATAIRHVRVSGGVKDGVATLACEAEVSVLASGEVALVLPLRGVGLRRVTVDGTPARVLPDAGGIRVLLAGTGGAASDGAVIRRVAWELGTRVEAGEERGAGILSLPVPTAASGMLDLLVPGDVEVVLPSAIAAQAQAAQNQAQNQMSRGRPNLPDDARGSRGCVAWARGLEGDSTRVEGAFGGAASAGSTDVVVSWRPRRSVMEVTPYVVADERSVFCVRQGVVTLESAAVLEVYRAGRDRFALDLPPGFVVRSLVVEGEEVTHVQRGDRAELTFGAPRTGRFVVRLKAELTTGSGDERQSLVVQPLGFPDANRSSGLVGLAQGEGTVVTFEEVQGLERADARDIGAAQPPSGDRLLRVYRRLPGAGRIQLAAVSQAPRVDLVVRSVLGLGERELRALAIYQFRVQEGRVFRLSADVPGFEVETVQVREVRGGVANDPVHQLTVQGGSVLVELQQALRAGDELFLNLQAVKDEPQGLAGRTFDLPRLTGAPATSVRGHLGFAPDEGFRLTGSELSGLTAIPAAELPRSGLDVAGLVVGYRIDGADYAGKVHLTPRETRVSAHLTTHHRVAERVVETDTLLELDIEGAPVSALELLLPAGLGRIARIEAADLKDDRESLGLAADGRERWKLAFDERKSGRLPIRVRFDTTLGPAEAGADPAVELPRVTVVGAFRERGVVAVFSSDATELQAEPTGLRAIEVTDVTPLPGATLTGRPLFAYTHTGAEQHLKITIKRRDAAQILSAVVERMELRTSTAPDGLSRHEAVFHVRHLETQFFALRLPDGATLWSVVVAGQGVKPAEKDGLKIVPMPATSEGRNADTVSVTYTLRSPPWGVASRADLVAPQLLLDRDRPVPVLRTVWSLALPDDYRVLEYSGNLHGSQAEAARPIALGLWRSARELTFAFALLVLALGVGASARARAWLVGGLASSGGNARGLGQVALAVASRRGAQLGCLAVICLAVVGFCLLTAMRGTIDARVQSFERTASAPGGYRGDYAKQEAQGGSGVPSLDMPASTTPAPVEAPAAAFGYAEEELADGAEAKDKTHERRRMRESNAAPEAPPPPPQVAPAPRPARRPPRAPAAAEGRDRQERGRGLADEDGLFAGEDDTGADDAGPKAESEAQKPDMAGRAPMEPAMDPAQGPAEPEPMNQVAIPPGLLVVGKGGEETAKKLDDALTPVVTALALPLPEGPEGGRVGLRSLVLDLPIVGRGASFERPGGEARLVIELVRDDALTLAAGALALFGLVAGLLLPGRFRLSYLGVLLASLAVLTALPYVLQDGRWTPLLNALAVGVLAAGPVQAVRGLGRLAAGARSATTQSGPRDDALRALSVLDGVLAAGCLILTIFAVGGDAPREVSVFFGVTTATLLVGCVGLSLQARWALLPTLLVGLGMAGVGAIGLQESLRHGSNGGAQAFMVAWTLLFGLAGLSALALLAPRPVAGGGVAGPAAAAPLAAGRALAVLLALLLFGGGARADEPAPQGAGGEPPRVYVPYDPATPGQGTGEVYVPEDVYLDLWRRAYPERVTAPVVPPLAPYAISQVAYEGALEAQGLTLQAQVSVEILAAGWQRCPLGLAGTGLKSSRVQGGKAGARVRAAPAGGLELMAEGPGAYVLTLDLVVPFREGGYLFAAVPAHAATLRVRTAIRDRRVVVGGARAQVEEQADDGATVVDASLGDAQRVHLTLPTREVLSAGGASEAAATTRSVVWVRPGRVVVMSQVTFDVTGAGREGFLFEVPAGLEITSVQTEGLRAWRLDEQGRLELVLRRPTGARATVLVWGEQAVAPGTSRFKAPQVVATGVSREAGVIGVCVEPGLRARPVDPAPAALRQVAASQVQNLAGRMGAGEVERAYEFARRPAELELELVQEPVEIKADADVRGVILGDRMLLQVDIAYEVRRGKVHELAVAIPAGFELTQAPQGLDVREAAVVSEEGGARVLRLALATGLSGPGRLALVFERQLSGESTVPFPDVRPLGVGAETTAITVAAAQGLRVRPQQEAPPGLTARDVRAATRGHAALVGAAAGAEWVLAYQRQNGRVAGVAAVSLSVSRPSPRVTGSWTLHARVERDVVRYTLRVVYRIADAGASTFQLLLPEAVADRVVVDGENQREVRNEAAGEGARRLTVELQSPAEDAYELGATWEEVLGAGQRFTIPQVGLEGVERQARRFVLIETAADVSDKLEEAGLSGSIEKARASEAPVLPGPASDFSFAYRVGTPEGPWSASFHLKPREVKLPPAARVPWVELTSVFTTDGVVRHRARYRVHNLRLQFLRLQLPPKAEVWSVFVAGAPKRLHHEQGITLIPLPKGTDADLSFDVEVIFATPLPGAIGFGGELRPEAPVLRTPDVQVERTSWTLHVPADYDCRGFDGNLKPATAAASVVQVLVEDVNELKKLVDLAENASGSTKEVANSNLQLQLARVQGQIETCFALDVEKGAAGDRELLGKNRAEVQRLESTLAARRQQQQQQASSPSGSSDTSNVVVDGKNFERLNSGWYSNNEVAGENAKTRWAGVPQGGEAAGPGQAADQSWTLSIPEGQTLSLSNAEVFSGDYATQTELPAEQQRAQNTQNARRVLGNRGYDAGQQQQAEQQVVVGGKVITLEKALEQLQRAGVGGGMGSNGTYGGVDGDPAELAQAIDRLRARALYREGDEDGDGRLDRGSLATGRSEGLLSIQVPFETPGRAYHFATDTQEAPQLAFSVYPEGLGEQARRGGRGLVLLVLLVGLVRLGLLAPLAGRGAVQALLLGVAGILAAGVFLHVAGAVAALAVGLVGIRHGRLFAAGPQAGAAGPASS